MSDHDRHPNCTDAFNNIIHNLLSAKIHFAPCALFPIVKRFHLFSLSLKKKTKHKKAKRRSRCISVICFGRRLCGLCMFRNLFCFTSVSSFFALFEGKLLVWLKALFASPWLESVGEKRIVSRTCII